MGENETVKAGARGVRFHSVVLGALCALSCGAGTVYEKYQDWQLNAVEIADPKADTNVRNQMDFTRPLHGPWLTNPAADGMTVSFISRVRCGAAIEWREKGGEAWTRRWNTTYGFVDYSDVVHCFHLSGLNPGTEYEYRFVTAMNSHETPYTEVITGREIRTFRTLDPKRDRYRVWVTADFHGGSRLNLDPMYERTGAADADLYIFLGDNVEDRLGGEPAYYITFGFLDDVSRLWGGTKPSLFLRGNHDASGREAGQWGRFFPHPTGHAYYATAQGPVLFVSFDLVREWHRAPAAQEQFAAYQSEQTAWYRELKKSPAWRSAKFRIAMGHYGVQHDIAEADAVPPELAAEFNDQTPEGRLHLLLAGHTHAYSRHDPGAPGLKGIPPPKRPRKDGKLYLDDLTTFRYCQVIGRQCEALTIDVSPEKLVVKSHNWDTAEGKLHDAFEILPDGSVRDLAH